MADPAVHPAGGKHGRRSDSECCKVSMLCLEGKHASRGTRGQEVVGCGAHPSDRVYSDEVAAAAAE